MAHFLLSYALMLDELMSAMCGAIRTEDVPEWIDRTAGGAADRLGGNERVGGVLSTRRSGDRLGGPVTVASRQVVEVVALAPPPVVAKPVPHGRRWPLYAACAVTGGGLLTALLARH